MIVHPNDEFWSNYWNGISIIVTVLVSVGSFYFRSRLEERNKKRENYSNFLDKAYEKTLPKFLSFETENKSDDSQKIKDLTDILISADLINLKRNQLNTVEYFGTENEENEVMNNSAENPNLIDFPDYNSAFEDKIRSIIADKNNEKIVEIVTNSNSLLEGLITKYSNQQKESNQNTSLDEIGQKDFRITQAWILKQSYAEKAKYLVGVATSDKRVVGVYDLRNEHIVIQKDNNNRVDFNVKDNQNRIYLEGVKGVESPALPGLDNWTAMNPVLYYINYLKATDQYDDFGIDNIKKVLTTLNIDAKSDQEAEDMWKELSGRDVIVVRTYKFGKKDEKKLAE